MTENFKNELNNFSEVLFEEPMKRHTSFKIGGPAEIFINAGSAEEATRAVRLCRKHYVPFEIIGNGSNLLVADSGVCGAVICVGKGMSKITVDGNIVRAEGGALLSAVSKAALRASLSGMEFAAGIPGTVGGGVYMNAGAYGGEMKSIVRSVLYADDKGEIKRAEREELDFSYRHSMFSDKKFIILEAEIELEHGDEEAIREEMTELNRRRSEKQPLEYPSAGSTFKRPEGAFAGRLIEDAGLMGFSIGGAAVSEKHAGFVINRGNATQKDVSDLIEHIRSVVFEKYGIRLEPEVRFIGF